MSDNPNHREFLIEAEDIIQSLSKNLNYLRALLGSSISVNPDIIDALFRGMHTLKGDSSLLGFSRIAVLSHKLEDLLDNMRLGQIKLTSSIVDILSEGVDVLVRLLSDINDKDGEYSEIDSILDKIGETIEEEVTPGEESTWGASNIKSALLDGLSDYEAHRLVENIKYGLALYRITANFSVDTIDEGISILKDKLAGFGEVIAFIPASGISAENGIIFEIIFASKEAEIKGRIGDIVDGNITNIEAIRASIQKPSMANTGSTELSAKSFSMAVRVGVERLDTLLNTVGEIFLLNDTIFNVIKEMKIDRDNNRSIVEANKASRDLFKKLSILRDDLIEIRMARIGYMFDRLSRIVDKLCKELSKEIKMEIYGSDTKLDKFMIEGLADPLMHIIRNAVDHGIEDEETRSAAGKPKIGSINLRAIQRDGKVLIEIEDDGGGIDLKKIHAVALERGFINEGDKPDETRLIELLFQPGFSTSKTINEVSGRGVGLDIVAKNIADLGGMIDVETKSGKGAKFSITLPLTLLITKALIVTESDRSFAIPFNSIFESLMIGDSDIKRTRKQEVFNLRGHFIPLMRLGDVLKFASPPLSPLPQGGERSRCISMFPPPLFPPPLMGGGEGEGEKGFSDETPSPLPSPLRGEGWVRGLFSDETTGGSSYKGKGDKSYVIVVGLAEKRAGIVVDEIKAQREILIKPVSELIGCAPGIAGFTEIGAKRILPVLDVGGILEMYKVV